MLPPAVVGGVVQGVGSYLGGKKRAGEARVARRRADVLALEAIVARKKEAKAFRDYVAKNGRHDFSQLVRDAEKAGFNPLTVLQATGGAGYDSAGLIAPFGSIADDHWRRVETFAGMSGMVVDNAGYLGEAIQAGGNAYFTEKARQDALALENERLQVLRQASSPVANGSPFHNAPVVQRRGTADVQQASYVGPDAVRSVQFQDVPASRTDVVYGGSAIKRDPATGNASDWEDRYGEPGSWIGGFTVGLRDFAYAVKQDWAKAAKSRQGVWDSLMPGGSFPTGGGKSGGGQLMLP